jgi:dTDP-4-amino-4,6-dideoxygalactose transaminase
VRDSRFIPIARPDLGEEEAEAARRVILSGWVAQGPEADAFEHEFAAAVDAPYAVATSSGTAALTLSLMALGIGVGDEVITVSHSFIATANAVRNVGARPVFVDIRPDSFNIDPAGIAAAVSPRTRALLVVHQLGLPCDLPAILDIAARHGLAVVEDAACAVGSEVLSPAGWQRVGRPHGVMACFSFHARKVLTTGEGGMITTADAELDRRLRALRNHGADIPAHARHAADGIIMERYTAPGHNQRMTDIQAAIGRVQLAKLPTLLARRQALAGRYARLLRPLDWLVAPTEPSWTRGNWQSYCVRLADGAYQRRVMRHLLEHCIATRRGVMCAHREPAWPPGTWSCGPAGLANSEAAQDCGLMLPLYPGLSDADQDRIVAALSTVPPS